MQRKLFSLIVLSLLLAACSGQAALTQPTATQSAEVAQGSQVKPALAPSQTPQAAAEFTPTAVSQTQANTTAQTTGGVTLFEINPDESQVNYEVNETFFSQGNVIATAIGVTKQITGQVSIDYTNPQNSTVGTITIDISQFTSDSNRRDNAIRDRWLESSNYPLAAFTPTSIEGLPAVGEEGVDYPLKITGDLTVKETTQPVTFDATIRLEGDRLVGTATTTLLMSDYGVGPISIAGILETQDEVKLTLIFVAYPAQ
jgi:polyisoprenoid-binding protein YceI